MSINKVLCGLLVATMLSALIQPSDARLNANSESPEEPSPGTHTSTSYARTRTRGAPGYYTAPGTHISTSFAETKLRELNARRRLGVDDKVNTYEREQLLLLKAEIVESILVKRATSHDDPRVAQLQKIEKKLVALKTRRRLPDGAEPIDVDIPAVDLKKDLDKMVKKGDAETSNNWISHGKDFVLKLSDQSLGKYMDTQKDIFIKVSDTIYKISHEVFECYKDANKTEFAKFVRNMEHIEAMADKYITCLINNKDDPDKVPICTPLLPGQAPNCDTCRGMKTMPGFFWWMERTQCDTCNGSGKKRACSKCSGAGEVPGRVFGTNQCPKCCGAKWE